MVRADPGAVPQGTRGQRSQARRKVPRTRLVILDAGDMPHDALAVGGPHVDAETEIVRVTAIASSPLSRGW